LSNHWFDGHHIIFEIISLMQCQAHGGRQVTIHLPYIINIPKTTNIETSRHHVEEQGASIKNAT
jgi:hypothetical protein